jgi:hypothetical protein
LWPLDGVPEPGAVVPLARMLKVVAKFELPAIELLENLDLCLVEECGPDPPAEADDCPPPFERNLDPT